MRPLFLSSLILCLVSVTALAETRPNFLIFLTDDQDMHEIGFTGAEVLTPALDRLSEEGVTFNNMQLASTVCAPSRYNVLTGRYASHFKGWDNHWLQYNHRYILFGVQSLPGDPNLATALGGAGYFTGFIGKVDGFLAEGFNKDTKAVFKKNKFDFNNPEHNRLLKEAHDRSSAYLREQIGFDFAEGLTPGNKGDLGVDGLRNNLDWLTQRSFDFIDRAAESGEPFCLVVAPPILHMSDARPSVEMDRRKTFEGLLDAPYNVLPSAQDVYTRLMEAGLPEKAAPVLHQDDSLRAMVQKLRETGLEENTLIVFMSDHGGGGGKGSPYQIGSHLPMVFRWKGMTDGQPDVEQVVSSVDLLPTLMDLANASYPRNARIDGVSLVPALKGQAVPERPVLIESANTKAVVKGDWKYISFRFPEQTLQQLPAGFKQDRMHIWNPNMPGNNLVFEPMISGAIHKHPAYYYADQLYHLAEDPAEQNNLAADPAHQAKLEEMKAAMAAALKPIPGTWGDLKFEIRLKRNVLTDPLHHEGDLDLTAPYNVLSVYYGSRLKDDRYVVITYTGERLGEFDDIENVEAQGYTVDYSVPGEIALVRQ